MPCGLLWERSEGAAPGKVLERMATCLEELLESSHGCRQRTCQEVAEMGSMERWRGLLNWALKVG